MKHYTRGQFTITFTLADTAAEERRIIERYRNHDPLDYLDPLRNRD